jgi:hypothetical protein
MFLPKLRQLGAQCLFFFVRHKGAERPRCVAVLGWPQRFAKRLESSSQTTGGVAETPRPKGGVTKAAMSDLICVSLKQ